MEGSLKLYAELLSLRAKPKGVMKHDGKWVLLDDARSSQRLKINWHPLDSPFATPDPTSERLDHIGFKVKDASLVYKQLVSKGLPQP